MVSTRGVKSLKYKFSEGERVLCYEPDPTKAKVLYDSKVLEVIESKDKRGRRSVEYLIHFQGWNSSWDRCVSEDFVLKDTEENRQLQKDLANKSQLQLGAYLYRRERKKPNATITSSSCGPPAKRSKQGYEDDGSSSSTQPEETVKEPEHPDTDSSGGSGAKTGATQEAVADQQPPRGRAQLVLPAALRNRLTFDYHLVVKRGLLSRLPAQPTVADILEGYLVWFARSKAWQTSKNKSELPPKPDVRDVIARVNLVREVLDGIRVYFDFTLHKHLLYRQELEQYSNICQQFMVQYNLKLKMKANPVKNEEAEVEGEGEENCEQGEEVDYEAEMIEAAQEELKSPKLPEYAHLPPDPVETVGNPGNTGSPGDIEPKPSTSTDIEEPTQTRHSTRKHEKVSMEEKETAREVKPAQNKRPATRGSARRLRSHKSTLSPSEAEEAHGSGSSTETKSIEKKAGTEHPKGADCTETLGNTETRSTARKASSTRTPLTLLLDKAAKWKVIPRENTDHVPCRNYGAIHLARLFVKLPDFLNATQMADEKLKVILKHIDMFVQYLDDHSEWFGEVYYYGDNATLT